MKLELIGKDYDGESYKCGNYEIMRKTWGKTQHFTIYAANAQLADDRYCPEIFDRPDREFGGTKEFVIQTTSYGALNVEEMQRMIARLNEAIEVVKVLTEQFVKEADK